MMEPWNVNLVLATASPARKILKIAFCALIIELTVQVALALQDFTIRMVFVKLAIPIVKNV